MINSFDELTHKDKIYNCYLDKELWIKDQVHQKNVQLRSLNKPNIMLGLFDVIPFDELHSPGKSILLIEHILKNRDSIVRPFVEIPRSIYGIYYMPEQTWHREIKQDFNCFINRNDPIRQSWFYLLYHRKLLEQGYVSFNGTSRLEKTSNLEYFDRIHQQTLNSFDSIYNEIRNLVPFKNFKETGNLCDTIMSTKFSIVLETYVDRTDAITFSEKTFRVLQTPRPWLLFHATNTIKELRNMGFYVYDDFVDHSYDNFDTSQNSVSRQESILKQAINLTSLKVTDSILDYWERKTKQNCEILRDLNSTWQHDVLTAIHHSYKLALETN